MKSKRPQNHHPISTNQPLCLFYHRKELNSAVTRLGTVPAGHCSAHRGRQVARGVGGTAPFQPGKQNQKPVSQSRVLVNTNK